MRLLLDTHVLMWLWLDEARVPPAIEAVLADPINEVSVPSVCAWEIANKVRIGKLPAMAPHVAEYGELVASAGFRHLDLRFDHALRAGMLPGTHRDPFDRLIAAQAMIEDMTLVTRDEQMANLGCKTAW